MRPTCPKYAELYYGGLQESEMHVEGVSLACVPM